MCGFFFSDQITRRGIVIGVDLQSMEPIEGVVLFPGHDFTLPDTQDKILTTLDNRLADVVISDMAPSASGHNDLDHDRIAKLCLSVLQFSTRVLKSGGHVLCKIWDGQDCEYLMKIMERMFKTVKIVKPSASRAGSAEVYLLGVNYFLQKRTT